MRIDKKVVKYFLCEFILCFIAIYTMLSYNSQMQNKAESILGALALVNIILYFLILNRIHKEIFSVSSLFIIFMYLFNLGLPICRIMGWIGEEQYTFLNRRIYSMGGNILIGFSTYGFLLISMLQVGTIYFYARNRMVEGVEKSIDYEIQLQYCRGIGIICILIGIVPYFYGEYQIIRNGLLYTYQSAESMLNLSGTGIGLIGNLFIVGVMLLMFGLQKNRIKFDVLFFSLSAYQIGRMLITGDRSTGVALILVWILVRHKFVVPIHGKKVALYIFIIYFAMLLLKYIEMTRGITQKSEEEIFHELLQSNMLVETVFEYGGNVWCGMMVYYSVPATAFFRCGTTYLAGLIGKPLQILGITDAVWRYADFSWFLQEPERGALINSLTAAMGGSFSGEWYYNFGWIGIIIIPVFGYLLANFSDACVNYKKNPVVSAYFLYVATLVIWWVRQYFTSVSWFALFYGIVIWALYQLIVFYKIRKA